MNSGKCREELQKQLCGAVKEGLGKGETVQFHQIRKNNGVLHPAFMIGKTRAKEAAVIYISGYLKMLEAGETDIQEAAQEILYRYYEYGKPKMPEYVRGFTKADILEKVEYALINYEKNEDILGGIPYKQVFDLAAVYCLVIRNGEVSGNVMINRLLLEKYSIHEEELDRAARENTRKKGFQVQTMPAVMEALTGVPKKELEILAPLSVAAIKDGAYGAAVLLYEECFEKIAEEAGADLYILPASIHEVLVIPVDEMPPEDLKDMVEAVNASEVLEEDILSGNIYLYNREKHRIEAV